ncbi:hypothetical protein EVAR_100220_1 [Eumeta japonica]|uniref:Uncharacterized protein n=1 Tax=Eumeta variegata TaxID=151549 RepID=A0A4C1ZN16_EUMVA|nr:hypothetical protein EVAR_100220_1 [Eumeta japonica]
MRSRGAELRSLLLSIQECQTGISVRPKTSEPPARFSRPHLPDVVGKNIYGRVNLVYSIDVIRNAVKGWSVDFLKRGRHFFSVSYFTGRICPPAVGTSHFQHDHYGNFLQRCSGAFRKRTTRSLLTRFRCICNALRKQCKRSINALQHRKCIDRNVRPYRTTLEEEWREDGVCIMNQLSIS